MRSTVFGLDVRSDGPLPSLRRARAGPTGRALEVAELAGDVSRLGWPREARTICTQRHRDGGVCFRIDAHPHAGYLIWGQRRGSFLLTRDGGRLHCVPEGCPRAIWERFLVGQVLPFAALVAGLEIFHASAVSIDGRTVAFVGPSGAGKTSLALAASRRGAAFFADDVLALQAHQQTLIAQPGTPLAGVVGRGEKRLMQVDGAPGPAPLEALFFLDRSAEEGSGEPRFEPVADARMLLACTFNFVLDTPRRMRGLLDVCALAAQRRVERIRIPPAVDAAALAQAVLARLDAAPGVHPVVDGGALTQAVLAGPGGAA